MAIILIPVPKEGDYAAYYERYISRHKNEDIIDVLIGQSHHARSLFGRISDGNGDFRYAEDKWSVKDLLQHVIDTERVFAYRALALSRGETQQLPGFGQDAWVESAAAHSRVLSDLVAEFEIVRASSYVLLSRLTEDQLKRNGIASGYSLRVNAIPFILAGHYEHHAEIVLERYASVIE